MRCRVIFGLSAVTLFSLSFLPGGAVGQQRTIKELLPGAWIFVGAVAENPDGSKAEPFGTNPKGIIIFTGDSHFSLFQSRADVPKIATNDRAKATPEEATGVVRATIAYYGIYSVNETEKTLSVRIDGSTFANLIAGPEQKRIITSLTAEELKFTNPRTPAGVTLQTVWRRAKAP
jgi:hypothetical protein